MKSLNEINVSDLTKLYQKLNIKYKKKINIQKYLEKKKFNNETSINISYDIQSGSYIDFFNKLPKNKIDLVYSQIIDVFEKNFKDCKTILDFGCGELTSSTFILKNISKHIKKYFATDISLNRLFLGNRYAKKKLTKSQYKKLSIFCNSNNKLPFKNNSIDLILTVHSLEPNNKKKNLILNELLRVSKKGLLLMEPCYERSSKKQQIRMRKYNYIRGLEKSLSAKNCYVQIIKKKHHLNELNESAIFIVKKMHKIKTKNSCEFVDPINRKELKTINQYLYSNKTLRLYPRFGDIFIFNELSKFYLSRI